jgi:hypothetical protein
VDLHKGSSNVGFQISHPTIIPPPKSSASFPMTFFASGADRLSAKVIGTYNALNLAFRRRRDCASAWVTVGESLSRLGLSQAPELAAPMADLTKLFSELEEVHSTLSLAEERNCEDVRDIIERFVVVYNASDAYNALRDDYGASARKVRAHREKMEHQSVRADYDLHRYKLEQELAALKEKRYTLLVRYKPALYRNMVQREKYNRFKVRRFRHGFRTYATALKHAYEREVEIFTRLKELLLGLEDALPAEIEDEIADVLRAPVPAAASAQTFEVAAGEVEMADLAPDHAEGGSREPEAAANPDPVDEPAPVAGDPLEESPFFNEI